MRIRCRSRCWGRLLMEFCLYSFDYVEYTIFFILNKSEPVYLLLITQRSAMEVLGYLQPYVLEWLNMLVRWLHVITGIAWIGASFYFVWLDNSLRPPAPGSELAAKGVSGELWAVHGGGFYNPQKYLVAPAQLPKDLHWFKWEAYSTW